MSVHDVLTVDFFPEKIPLPKVTQEDCLNQTAEDTLHLLKPQDDSKAAPPLHFGPPILNAFAKVADILGHAVAPPPAAPASPTAASIKPVLVPKAPVSLEPPRLPLSPSPFAPPRVPMQTPEQEKVPTALAKPNKTFRHPNPRFSHVCIRNSPLRYDHWQRVQLAQSMQHDPSVAGKCFNPDTGQAKTIKSLLEGPDQPSGQNR